MKSHDNQDAANFLLEDFQRKVNDAIQDYDRRTTKIPIRRRRMGGKTSNRKPTRIKRDSARKMERNIAKILQLPEIRENLCRVLQTVSDDAFEVSKAVTPVLLTLIATGSLRIEPQPLVFAGIILSITRMGISFFCPEKPDKTKRSLRKSIKDDVVKNKQESQKKRTG